MGRIHVSENQTRPKAKNKVITLKNYSNPNIRRAQAQQLQKELDSLALLLEEVKKQTDRVGAAADAIGDALIGALEPAAVAHHAKATRRKAESLSLAIRQKESAWTVREQSDELQQA